MFRACIKAPLSLIVFFTISIGCNALDIIEGKHYLVLGDEVRFHEDVQQLFQQEPNKTHVIEFFSYGCYWCSQVHKPFADWASKQSAQVAIDKFPVMFNKMWTILAQVYYTAVSLDKTGELDNEIFLAIHKKGKKLWMQDEMVKFFEDKGYKRDLVLDTFKSYTTSRKIHRADELARAFNIAATPNIVITNDRNTYLTNLTMTTDIKSLFAIVDFLVAKELKKIS